MSYTPKASNKEQASAINKMALELERNAEDFVWQVSGGRTTSVSNLTYKEAGKLIVWLDEQTNKHKKICR